MIENGKIGKIQYAMLAITSLTIIGHLILLSLTLYESKQDAWIAAIIGAVFAIPSMLALHKLVKPFKRMTLIEILYFRFSWIGKGIAVTYLMYFLLMLIVGVRLFGETYELQSPGTPMVMFFIILLVLAVSVAITGIEPLARFTQILLPILVFSALVVVFLSLDDKDYSYLLPILGNGFSPVIKGAVTILGWYGQFVVMGMVYPYVNQKKKMSKNHLGVNLLTMVFILGPIIGPVAIFGPNQAAQLPFPTYSELRYISAGTVFNRMDAVAILFWTVGLTVYTSLFLYVLALGTAQILKTKSYRPLVPCFGWLAGIGAVLLANDFQEVRLFLFRIYVPMNIVMGILLPIVLALFVPLAKKTKTIPSSD